MGPSARWLLPPARAPTAAPCAAEAAGVAAAAAEEGAGAAEGSVRPAPAVGAAGRCRSSVSGAAELVVGLLEGVQVEEPGAAEVDFEVGESCDAAPGATAPTVAGGVGVLELLTLLTAGVGCAAAEEREVKGTEETGGGFAGAVCDDPAAAVPPPTGEPGTVAALPGKPPGGYGNGGNPRIIGGKNGSGG